MRAQWLVLQPRLSLEQLSLSVDSRVDVGGAKRGHPPDEVPRPRVDGLALTPLGRTGLHASARVASGLAGLIWSGVDLQDLCPRLRSEGFKVEPRRLEALLLCGCASPPGQGPAGRRRRKAEAEEKNALAACRRHAHRERRAGGQCFCSTFWGDAQRALMTHDANRTQAGMACTSHFRSDAPVTTCDSFCNMTHSNRHCSWCKCKACVLCGGDALNLPTRRGGKWIVRLPQGTPIKVVVCLYGTLARSIQHTWPVISRRVIAPLVAAGHTVAVYGWSMELEAIDGVTANQSAVHTVPWTVFQSARQADVDELIEKRCADTPAWCEEHQGGIFQADGWHGVGPRKPVLGHERRFSSRNGFRQLYSEWRVGGFLQSPEGSKYDAAVVLSPDYHVALDIDVEAVYRSASLRDTVYTTSINDGMFSHLHANLSITDGFYFGAPRALSRVLQRYDNLTAIRKFLRRFHSTGPLDFEAVLGGAFRKAKISREVTPMVFFKIRANGVPDWQGGHNIRALPEASQRKVVREWSKLTLKLCALEYTPPKKGVHVSTARDYTCACHGQARFGTPGNFSIWQPVEMSDSRRTNYMRCEASLFSRPRYRASSNMTRRRCQCRVSETQHVDREGPYALPWARAYAGKRMAQGR